MKIGPIEFDRVSISLLRITYHNGRKGVTVHIGQGISDWGVWFPGADESVCFTGRLWGRATEEYDMAIEYYGLGPFGLVCW